MNEAKPRLGSLLEGLNGDHRGTVRSATAACAPVPLRKNHRYECEETTMKKLLTILAGLTAIAFLVNPDVTEADDYDDYNSRGCAWPLMLSPEGPANFQGPDDAARYWIMPFDTTNYKAMTIHGTYPHIRYFAIVAYETGGESPFYTFEVGDPLHDAEINPDQGSSNPFVQPGGSNGTYTVEISRAESPGTPNKMTVSSGGSPNTMTVTSNLAWIVLRAYVPDADASLTGHSLMGGVPLPTITLTDYDGGSELLETCSPINKWSDLIALGRLLFPPEIDLPAKQGTPSSNRLWFAAPQEVAGNLWPNPDGKYLMMLPGDEYQLGRVIVIHAKAPGFPDTFNGSPIWEPARGFRSVDLRYWAVCNMNLTSPPSVVACATDLTTRLQAQYYTIVISDDRQRPDWLQPNINWLPWGDVQYPKFVVLRNTLPSPDFPHDAKDVWDAWHDAGYDCAFEFTLATEIVDREALDKAGPCAQDVMGDYYPVALWCDKATFRAGGFQACLRDGD